VQALALYQALGGSEYRPGRRMRVALRVTAIGAVVAQCLRYARPCDAGS